jgi:hypothetical protein
VADLAEGIALYLTAKSLLTYGPDGTGGDTFLDDMPSAPDQAIALTLYEASNSEPDSLLGYDEPRLQVRVRGTQDATVSRDRCRAIYEELHGLGPIVLPDGTRLILCVALQHGPAALGKDANGRHEHVCNFRAEIRSVTAHRV